MLTGSWLRGRDQGGIAYTPTTSPHSTTQTLAISFSNTNYIPLAANLQTTASSEGTVTTYSSVAKTVNQVELATSMSGAATVRFVCIGW